MPKRKTAWAIMNPETGQISMGAGKNHRFSNAGKLYKTAGVCKGSVERGTTLDKRAKVVRVRLVVEEEYDVDEFLEKYQELQTP